MALTIHAPHLPHLEDLGKHRTMLIGLAAVSITAGTVYVVQQQINDSAPTATLSAPAATGSASLDSSYTVAEANRMAALRVLPAGSVAPSLDASYTVAEANRMAALRDLPRAPGVR